MSKVAILIAKKGLGVKSQDPMSGFFAFKKNIIKGLQFDAIGYKMLLEILVKTKGIKIQEIPYTFTDREKGTSKLGMGIVLDYCKSVWKLYKYGRQVRNEEQRTSVRFFSKAARFFTIGAIGLGDKLSSIYIICIKCGYMVSSCNHDRNNIFHYK